MTPPDPGVYIPPGQMYAELRSLSDSLVRVETKLDGIARGLNEVGKDVADHEVRIRAVEHGTTDRQKNDASRVDGIEARVSGVERRVWMATGAATVIGTAGGILAQALMR